ncbi:hypothetical protein EOPP23_06115 [Endozoicomonas sp. OPT23]|uniref:hypothetical protein n=1 Tax=Endozoicomonas sp. OPT23 TaxID=2072845 RepID=UPI00129BBECD|nr:hypothetical protein [Endozoicomonas sp. OPT23]MRI32560.1 hypothetical protein [Endozoicomonas sp. OPT23]
MVVSIFYRFGFWLSALLCLSSGAFAAQLISGDPGCNTYAVCEFEYHSANSTRRNIIKLKRLDRLNISASGWSGSTDLTGETPQLNTGNSGLEFCILAYEDPPGGGRDVHNYRITVEGSDLLLRHTSVPGSSLPVELRIGRDGGSDSVSFLKDQDNSLTINSEDVGGTSCLNREFSIYATVRLQDLLAVSSVGPFEGTFSITVESIPTTGAVVRVRKSFSVRLFSGENGPLPVLYRVSGLKDMELSSADAGDSWLFKDMSFCVFALGQSNYALSLDTDNHEGGSFGLVNGDNNIPYRVSFRPSNTSQWSSIETEGRIGTGRGSSSLNCDSSVNAMLRVEVAVPDLEAAPAGVYTDVMEVTVSAI